MKGMLNTFRPVRGRRDLLPAQGRALSHLQLLGARLQRLAGQPVHHAPEQPMERHLDIVRQADDLRSRRRLGTGTLWPAGPAGDERRTAAARQPKDRAEFRHLLGRARRYAVLLPGLAGAGWG